MFHLDLTCEDSRLIATEGPNFSATGPWRITILDSLSGTTAHREWTSAQLAAIVALAIAGDEQEGAEQLYSIAEPAVAGLPPELRPIP